jgi:hypothetical protein
METVMMLKRFLFGAVALALPGASGAAAEPARITTSYGMAVIGLPIGKASFDTVIDGKRFTVEGQLSSSGLGSLVSTTGGTSRVSGTVTGRGFAAERYALDYSSNRKRWSSDVAFAGGRVTSSKVSPKREKARPSYVPVERAELASVVDPLSGLMIRAGKPAAVCSRTLPLYDGWSRLDLAMSPGGTSTYSMSGYSGDAVVCNARIRPVSGYDRSSKGLNFLKDQTIQVWFAAIAQPDVYVPVYARIPTQVGPLTLSALSVAVR